MGLKGLKDNFLNNWEKYVLMALISLGLLLRFYDYPYRYGLGDETVRDAVVATIGVREIQVPLTGPFSSAGLFTFGPWYYYQLILSRLIFPVMYAPWIYLSLASAICIALGYKIGEVLISKKFGILLAFIVTISPSLILAGTHLTNPNLSNVFAFLAVYIFLLLVKKDVSYWWAFGLGISLGIAINIHYQMFGLLVLPAILLIVKPKRYLNSLCVLVGLLVTFVPLILFDLNNHLFNFRNLVYYYTEGKNLIYVPNRWLFYLRDFWPSYLEEVTGVPRAFTPLMVVAFLAVTATLVYKRKISKLLMLIFIAFLVNFILLRYYWGERFFGYLNFLRPFILIFEGMTIYYIYNVIKHSRIKVIFLAITVLLLFALNVPKILDVLKRDLFSMNMYKIEEQLLYTFPNDKFKLFICPGPGNTYYSSQSHSLLYLLDNHDKLSNSGRAIAFGNKDCLPQGIVSVNGYKNADHNLIGIGDSGLVDLSLHSSASISGMGFKHHTLRNIYDNTVRWWFSEQP